MPPHTTVYRHGHWDQDVGCRLLLSFVIMRRQRYCELWSQRHRHVAIVCARIETSDQFQEITTTLAAMVVLIKLTLPP